MVVFAVYSDCYMWLLHGSDVFCPMATCFCPRATEIIVLHKYNVWHPGLQGYVRTFCQN